MSRLDPLLQTLAEAPDNQIAAELTKRIATLIGSNDEIVASELKEIKDLCINESLCSDFAIMVLSEAIHIAQTKD